MHSAQWLYHVRNGMTQKFENSSVWIRRSLKTILNSRYLLFITKSCDMGFQTGHYQRIKSMRNSYITQVDVGSETIAH